jgi:membrane protein YqaA with SNARE-associated domain
MELAELFAAPQGLPALFCISFLAATILPLGSEWLLVLLILGGHQAPAVVAIATLGNYLGACTTYLVGFLGSDFLTRKLLRLSARDTLRAQEVYRRYGVWSLLLSWVPVVGDPLCLLAGSLRTPLMPFSILVLIGKFCRYAAISLLTLQGMR